VRSPLRINITLRALALAALFSCSSRSELAESNDPFSAYAPGDDWSDDEDDPRCRKRDRCYGQMGNNQKENEEVARAIREVERRRGCKFKKEQIRAVHDAISKGGKGTLEDCKLLDWDKLLEKVDEVAELAGDACSDGGKALRGCKKWGQRGGKMCEWVGWAILCHEIGNGTATAGMCIDAVSPVPFPVAECLEEWQEDQFEDQMREDQIEAELDQQDAECKAVERCRQRAENTNYCNIAQGIMDGLCEGKPEHEVPLVVAFDCTKKCVEQMQQPEYDLGVQNCVRACVSGVNQCLNDLLNGGSGMGDGGGAECEPPPPPPPPAEFEDEPSDDPTWPDEPADPTGTAWGDPHFTTYDGLAYDYQGVGEFWLLRSASAKIDFAARFVPAGPGVSITDAAALSVVDPIDHTHHTMSFFPGRSQPFWIDGVAREADVSSGGWLVSWTGLPVGYQVTYDGNSFTIRGEIGELRVSPQFASARPKRSFTDVRGLFGGASDHDPTNDLLDATGQTITGTLAAGLESWRTTALDSPFHYRAGESWSTFQDPTFPNAPPPEASPEARAEAEMVCAGVADQTNRENCEHDYAMTGDATAAEAAADAPPPMAVVVEEGD
jgi:hypothetical protein